MIDRCGKRFQAVSVCRWSAFMWLENNRKWQDRSHGLSHACARVRRAFERPIFSCLHNSMI